MSQKTFDNRESLHLVALHGLAYLTVVLLFVNWMAPPLAVAMAAAGVMAGCLLEPWLRSLRVRWYAAVAAGLLIVMTGFLLAAGLVSLPLFVRLLGLAGTVNLYFAAGCGLGVFGGVVALRSLTRRWSSMALVEAALLVALATWTLAGHRDYKITHPRLLSDWAMTHGYDPRAILWGIGTAALAAVVILRFPNQSWRKTAAGIAVLLLCGLLALVTLNIYADSLVEPPPPSFDKAPLDEPNPPPPPPIPPTPSFAGHDWQKDPKPLAIVTLHDDLAPLEFGYYFRDSAFSEMRDSRLWRCPVDSDVPQQFPTGPLDVPGVAASADDTLVPSTVSLITQLPLPFGLVTPTHFEPKANANSKAFVMTYGVTSRVCRYEGIRLYELQAGNSSWSAAQRQHYLAVPADPRYTELAAEITGKIDRSRIKEQFRRSPLLEAMAIRNWLQENCTYSLHPSTPQSGDPNAEFLFGDKRGFCVHAAQSMALLLRSRGIPARLASGFMVPAARRGKGSGIMLQANDAHCWCEIYLDGAGWIPFDVSMSKSEEPDPPQVDPATQQWFNDQNRRESDPLADTGSLNAAEAALTAGLLVLILVLVGLYGIKAERRYVHRWAADRQLSRLCYRSVLDRLAEVGVCRQFGESREDFARRVGGLVPEFLALSDAHLQQWLSNRPVLNRAGWFELENRCLVSFTAAIPRPRRILGQLNPIGWLFAR